MQVGAEAGSGDRPETPSAEEAAFVQYTSGSTGTPRGVVVTHANLVHNNRIIAARFEHSRDTVMVGWLPLFHDMGLVGNVLQPLYLGATSVLMPPAAFLLEPVRWLRAISEHRGTTSGAPNFAYDLCVERVRPDQLDGIDLGCWTCAFNGSEPVRARTLERFAERFAPRGFRREAFYPCYGMAEATLFISGGEKREAPREARMEAADGSATVVVSSGRTEPDHEIAVVDPQTCRRLPQGEVGEIWFSGPSVSTAYWNRPEESAQRLMARLPGEQDRRYLRTGDLGFLLDGELYVTGRIKDVMIFRGRNHYPHDIEMTVQESHPALRRDAGAAFVVEHADTQALVVVQEVHRTSLRALPLEEIAGEVRAAVSREHGLHVGAVVLVKTGSIPKTTSGKIRRGLSRELFLNGGLATVGESLHGRRFWNEARARSAGDARQQTEAAS